MEKNNVKTILEGLKSSTSKRIQDSLLKIKTLVANREKGLKAFRECNGYEYLVPHLLKPNESILNLTLSILGDLSLDQKSCVLIGKLNSYGPLVTILKTVCRDSILGRTSRFIGNLSREICNAEKFHSHGAVKALVEIIDNRDKKTSFATLIMVVRAIRKLWSVEEKRSEMLSMNAVRCVALLMINECEAMGVINKSSSESDDEPKGIQEELMGGILKCIWSFTSYPVSACAEQIQGDGRGFQCLVILTQTHLTVAMKCLTNLCFVSNTRPLLGMAGFVECLVEHLQQYTDVISWPDGTPMALAQLSGEAVNRSRLRRCGGLPLLVTAAKCNMHAMNALLQYVFDDTSFQLLIREGLVNILTNKLTTYVREMGWEHNVELVGSSYRPKQRQRSHRGAVYDVAVQNLSKDLLYRPAGSGKFKRKSKLLSKTQDDLKVVIERDNMIVGFVDAIDSDESESESDDDEPPPTKKSTKRTKSKNPKNSKKKSNSNKAASKDWSAGVFWEPKSPDLPSICANPSSTPKKEPSYPDLNILYQGPGSVDRAQFEWSPESGVSCSEIALTSPFGQWSPAGNYSSSPGYSNEEDSSSSEVSGRYSPVCNDDDKDADSSKASSSRAAQDADVIEIDDESGDEAEDMSKLDIHAQGTNIAAVMVLLFRVSHGTCTTCGSIRDDPVPNHTMDYLTSKECLYSLLEYVEKCKRPLGRASRILSRVISSDLCLMSVLRHRIALRLYHLSLTSQHPPEQCVQCRQTLKLSAKLLSQLGASAESSYGVGKISYHLLKGGPSMKQTLALTLPYIVKSEKILKKFLIDCNGLSVLVNSTAESKEEMTDCVTAFAKLAQNVNIKDPKLLEKRYSAIVSLAYDQSAKNIPKEKIVTFKLDDSSTVRANKEFLCQHSEYFSAMLMGRFKESGQNCVRLRNVSRNALEYLLTLLDCGLNDAQCDIKIFPMASHLKTNLEVLLLADRFLFEKLKELLSSAILQFKLGPTTADTIYTWSLSEGMGFLCVEAVAYILSGKMSDDERFQAFIHILSLQYKEQFLEDVKSMLTRQLVK